MIDVRRDCPDDETLGAFLEGRLDGEERERVVTHVAICERCIAGSAFFAEMAPAEVKPPVSGGRSRWPWLAVAALLTLAIGMAMFQRRVFDEREGIRALIAAAPTRYREVEPRLVGFRWAEMRNLRVDARPAADREALRLGGAAADVLERAERDASAEAAHAAGVAELLLHRAGDAAERLRGSVAKESSAATWSDLAAATYTNAVREERAAELPRALAAADRAIALDGAMLEPRFNRALILERMGLRDEAAVAWRDYLQRDPSSEWAEEARRHLERLERVPAPPPQSRLEQLEERAAARDRDAVAAILRAAPQDARTWMETDVLGRWGEASLRGETIAATRLLDAADETAGALQSFSGESLLADSVAAILAANDQRQSRLARAHATYRRGRLAFRDRRFDRATTMLLDAAHDFDEARSPMAGVARLFAASVLFDANRIGEAARLLESIDAAPGHEALRAQVAMRLGTCRMYEGRWEDAVRGFRDAAARFERLRERSNAATARSSLGNACDQLGARDEAWAHRIAALEGYGDDLASASRRLATIAAAARAELRAGQWDVARSLLRVETNLATALDDSLLLADVWRRRALVDARLGEDEAARDEIARCRAAAARASASGLRDRLLAEASIAEAAVVRRDDPARAIALLTASIDFLSRSGSRMALPDALFERGRALRDAARPAEALRDFDAALLEVEAQRRVAPDGSAIFDAVEALIEETIALRLEQNDAPGAFATAERARGNASSAAEIAAALPRDAMLIAYALVPDGVAAIAITRDDVQVMQQRAGRRQLADSIRALRTGIAARDELATLQSRAAELHRLLLAPLTGVRAASSLIVIPDRSLQSVPWAALYDEERRVFAVERYAITVASSGGSWLQNRAARRASAGERLLLVTAPSRKSTDPLDHVAIERAELARLYDVADGAGTLAARFLSQAADADVVHFAGHARTGPEPALLFGEGGELRAADIARARLARPHLVVLAACGTAAGRGEGFDGPRGLARAFLEAGVPAVVATLWPVDDAEAAALSVAFHRRLRAGGGAATALRDAQLSLLRGSSARFRHPAAWAAAELFGG